MNPEQLEISREPATTVGSLLILSEKIWKFRKYFLSLQAEMNKNLFIISGCNGAGKTKTKENYVK